MVVNPKYGPSVTKTQRIMRKVDELASPTGNSGLTERGEVFLDRNENLVRRPVFTLEMNTHAVAESAQKLH